ncbi:MAG TPA: M56 family metallopeptidase [Rhizomicrobium sp.]|nr:M56 family metallopeptidase [Rhizomicrobium sp.]
MIALLLNHLWQSSLCVGGAGLLTLALRRNGANVRFWLWFAASVKFLVPFALLTALSAYLLTPILSPVAAPAVILMKPLAQPFSAPSLTTAPASTAVLTAMPSFAPSLTAVPVVPAAALDLESALLVLWVAGFLIIALRWLVRWSRVRALLREAMAMKVDAPIAVKFSLSRLEPGLVGILRPVILLPQGIDQQLSAVELKAVLAHELSHWRRRDNLLAAIHMLVEVLFWFFPLVWWLGARLNAERERACDESVLADGNDPQMYAEGILKVCRAYLQSPLACVAGVSGAGLKNRIDAIMENRTIPQLNAVRKFVLGTSAVLALVLPLALGLAAAPVAQMQAKAAPILSRPLNTLRSADEATASAPHRRIEAVAKSPPEQLTAPSSNLSGALPTDNLAMPMATSSHRYVASLEQMRAISAPQAQIATDNLDFKVPQVTSNDQYPRPALKLRAPYGLEEWTHSQASAYCKEFAAETVVQGANRPMAMDDAAKQRYSFFYWHCMLGNGQVRVEPAIRGPVYLPVGMASSDHPTNVLGTWAISTPPWQPTRTCTFTQSGNTISGTCNGPQGSGPVFGVIDGRQVRWAWKFMAEDKRREGELDFIGIMESNATITGQSVLIKDLPFHQIAPFRAVHGNSVTQVASGK